MRRMLAAAIVLAALSAAGFAGEARAKIRAFVGIPPQKYFVDRIGGQYVETSVLVGQGQSPHAYEPAPRQIAALGEAQVYFEIGMPFEATLVGKIRSIYPGLRIVDTRKGVALRPADSRGYAEGGEPDPHFWLDPRLARVMAGTMADALAAIAPEHAEEFKANLASVEGDLDKAFARISAQLEPYRGDTFLVFHPAFGYFADAFGIKQAAIEIQGKEPSARDLAALVSRARSANVKAVFVEPQFSRRTAQTVAQSIGAEVVMLDPLARDYIANLDDMAARIEAALSAADGK